MDTILDMNVYDFTQDDSIDGCCGENEYTDCNMHFPSIPDYSLEQLLSNKTFSDFVKMTDGYGGEEIENVYKKFCIARLQNMIVNKETEKQKNGREELKEWMDADEIFCEEIENARRHLRIDKLKHLEKTYVDFGEALEDLVYQMYRR